MLPLKFRRSSLLWRKRASTKILSLLHPYNSEEHRQIRWTWWTKFRTNTGFVDLVDETARPPRSTREPIRSSGWSSQNTSLSSIFMMSS